MVLMTYQLPDSIRDIALEGEFNEFSLNEFFSAEGLGAATKFKYEDEVQKWLDLISRGIFFGDHGGQSQAWCAETPDAV